MIVKDRAHVVLVTANQPANQWLITPNCNYR